jgi:hypothetical protein
MSTTIREAWLTKAMALARPLFDKAGAPLPSEIRISCGLPSVGAFASKRRVGEAWSTTASKDQHHEVFISPTVDDPRQVLAILLHELVHCAVGLDCGHKGRFPIVGAKIGLVGPWTSTEAGDELAARLGDWSERLGDYPHKALEKMTNGRKKQTTRLVKCWCDACGYTVRTSLKWILIASPVCPDPECESNALPMSVGLPTGEEDEEGFVGSAKVRPI